MESREYIAIIGMSGIFPEANDLKQFLNNLRSGKDSVRKLSPERMAYSNIDSTKDYQITGFLDRVDFFDHKFFNISKKEAEQIEPAQRILLEKVCEAVEDAGYSLKEIEGSATTVFIGGNPYSDYSDLIDDYDATVYSGNLHAMQAGRISYTLNLTGPSLMIDTACSSSLVAVHEACQKLLLEEADMAIAGGIDILTTFPEMKQGPADLGIQSFDGKSKTFDANADGTGGGEGGGVVILKRLSEATRDRDHIYGIIKGSAINHDGNRSNGITAPSPTAQTEVIHKAWKRSDVMPEQIDYVEVHGTGTKLGDPIEFKGLTDAFNQFTDKKKFCALSALKTNIGHLNNAAGVAGLIKSLLAIDNQEIFPSLHFHEPNPFIDFENTAVYVNTELKPWKRNGHARLSGLSSFGLSGTNAHLVLQEPEPIEKTNATDSVNRFMLKASARSSAVLIDYLKNINDFLAATEESLADVTYTLNKGRGDYEYRVLIEGTDKTEIVHQIEQLVTSLEQDERSPIRLKEKSLVLLFSGEGIPTEVEEQLLQSFPQFGVEVNGMIEKLGGQYGSESVKIVLQQYVLFNLISSLGFQVKTIIATGIGKVTKQLINKEIQFTDVVKKVEDQALSQPLDKSKLRSAVDRLNINRDLLFVEVGTHGILSATLKEWKEELSNLEVLSALTGESLSDATLDIKQLYELGAIPDWKSFYREGAFRTISAPTYPFERIRCWAAEAAPIIDTQVAQSCFQTNWIKTPTRHKRKPISGERVLILSSYKAKSSTITDELISSQKEVKQISLADGIAEAKAFFDAVEGVFNPDTIIVDWPKLEITLDQIDSINDAVQARLALIKALYAYLEGHKPAMVFITEGAFDIEGTGKIDLLNNAGAAMVKSLISDHPDLTISLVDFDVSVDAQVLTEVLEEALAADNTSRISAYHQQERYVQNIVPFSAGSAHTNLIKHGGTYLISGGASGIGFEVGKSLVNAHNAKLIILGRRTLTEGNAELRDAIRQLEEKGNAIQYYSVDVSHKEALAKVIEEIKEGNGKVDGVIHAAGVPHKSTPLAEKSEEELNNVLAPKVSGTANLIELTKVLNPSFFVSFSSLNALFPQKHSTEYALANAFQNAVSEAMGNSDTQFISIAWTGWGETGMSTRNGEVTDTTEMLSNQEGVDVFKLVMGQPKTNVAVGKFSLDKIGENPFFLVNATEDQDDNLTNTEVLAEVATGEPKSIEDKVLAIWYEVLKADEIALDDDFFDIGGHSLNGTQVISRIESEFGVTMEFDELFDYATVNDIADYIRERLPEEVVQPESSTIKPIAKQEFYPVSHAQKRLWIESQFEESKNLYLMPLAYEIEGDINVKAFSAAIRSTIERHESLRTVFTTVDDQPMQRILDINERDFALKYEDKTGTLSREALDAAVLDEQTLGFDLEEGPLLRTKLLKFDEQKYLFLFTMHHLISDGWSLEVMLKDIATFYKHISEQTQPDLLPLSIQYKEYCAWQRDELSGVKLKLHQDFWHQVFAGDIPVLSLPTDYPRPKVKEYKGRHITHHFDKDLSEQIIALSQKDGTSLFMTLLGATSVMLYAQTLQTDIVIGTPIAGRTKRELEDQIGIYINTLPIRINFSEEDTFTRLIAKVKEVTLGAYEHQIYPFDKLVEELKIPRDLSRSPLFDVMIEMQEIMPHSDANNMAEDLKMTEYPRQVEISKYDLSFAYIREADVLKLSVEYDINLFNPERISYMINLLERLMHKTIDNNSLTLKELIREESKPTTGDDKDRFVEMDL
ncbi:MAG: SDR family NAD(P)-dependent oxidoreductase [Bacteroidota bacterium]